MLKSQNAISSKNVSHSPVQNNVSLRAEIFSGKLSPIPLWFKQRQRKRKQYFIFN